MLLEGKLFHIYNFNNELCGVSQNIIHTMTGTNGVAGILSRIMLSLGNGPLNLIYVCNIINYEQMWTLVK